ncbi:7415_t:CDS:2 [Rhizophagus irregularis]|nr:7415_t:CDS:2 [Rhizophagus irregularis]
MLRRTKRAETTEVIDLETGSSEVSTVTQSKSKHNDSENDDDDELEMEIDYKLVIKQADGSALPAKNYSGGNSNKIPKVSDISIIDQRIAKNVIELRKETWCSIHNSLATVKEPPTHLSFGYTHPSKNRSQSNLPQFSNNVQDLINPIFSTLLQALVTPHFLQQPSSSLTSNNSIVSQSSQSIPSMAEFL